jgi:hypothetical protein
LPISLTNIEERKREERKERKEKYLFDFVFLFSFFRQLGPEQGARGHDRAGAGADWSPAFRQYGTRPGNGTRNWTGKDPQIANSAIVYID